MSNLLSRVLVALIGLPVVLTLVWLGGWWLFALVAVTGLLSLHEFWLMTRSLRPLSIAGYGGTLLALVGAELGGVDWLVAGFLATLALAFMAKGIAATKAPSTVSIGATVLGVAWIGVGLGFLLQLRALPVHGVLICYTVLLAVWANDTLAYATGRTLGRHKLAPAISPGKTWEGFAGGAVGSVVIAFFALYDTRDTFLPIWQALLLGLAIAVAGPIGDLFESALKRDMQVKDSGRLLGGHGGVLDRIDALLFAGVAAYFVLDAFGWA